LFVTIAACGSGRAPSLHPVFILCSLIVKMLQLYNCILYALRLAVGWLLLNRFVTTNVIVAVACALDRY